MRAKPTSELDEATRHALRTERTIDITTVGRHSGQLRRIEMWFHNVDEAIYLTGTPGRRDWYANLLGQPRFTFHLKQSVVADLAAVAEPVTDMASRRLVLAEITSRVGAASRLERWVRSAPVVRVSFV